MDIEQELNELAARHELALSLNDSDPGFRLSNDDMRTIAAALRQAAGAPAVISKLREWAEEEQRQRYKAEEDRMNARSEIEQLRAVLRPFCTADWYVIGSGMFRGTVEKSVLDEAKDVLGMVPAPESHS